MYLFKLILSYVFETTHQINIKFSIEICLILSNIHYILLSYVRNPLKIEIYHRTMRNIKKYLKNSFTTLDVLERYQK